MKPAILAPFIKQQTTFLTTKKTLVSFICIYFLTNLLVNLTPNEV